MVRFCAQSPLKDFLMKKVQFMVRFQLQSPLFHQTLSNNDKFVHPNPALILAKNADYSNQAAAKCKFVNKAFIAVKLKLVLFSFVKPIA